MKSANILSVWQYSRLMSPFSVSFLYPFLYEEICDFNMFCSAWARLAAVLFEQHCAHVVLIQCRFFTSKPWLWRNYFVQKNCDDASWTPTSSLIVELTALIFCFLNALVTQTFPMEIIAPVCTFISAWVPYEVSNNKWKTFSIFALRWSFTVLIFVSRYLSTLQIFFQSSSSGFINLVVRNTIVGTMSGRARFLRKKSLDTNRWNIILSLSHNFYMRCRL